MKTAFLFVIIVGVFGLTGCKPKTTTLAGQVSIVTQSGDNIKLGDVQILLIDKGQVAAYLAKMQPIVNARIASVRNEFSVAKEKSKKAYRTHKANPQDQSIEQVWFEADDNLKAVMKILNDAQGVEVYFSDFLPDVNQKTVSDADGRFSFTYLRDKPLAIYATAKRAVPDELTDAIGGRQAITAVEEYCWLIDVPTNSDTVRVFLSNDNLVFNDPDRHFRVAPKQVPSNREFEKAYNDVLLQLEK